MTRTMLTVDHDFSIDVRDVEIVRGAPRARSVFAPAEAAILARVDRFYDLMDRGELPADVAAAVSELTNAGDLGKVLRERAITALKQAA